MNNPGRTLLGIGLLIAGVLFLLDNADIVDAGAIVSSWWPVVIIGFGITALIGQSRSLIGGSVITVVGVILLMASLELLPATASELLLPLILIAVGLGVLLVRAGVTSTGDDRNQSNVFAMFGGQSVVVRSKEFSGGSLTAVFGSVDLDLRSTTLSPNGAAVEVFAAFGGASVIVPRGWRVTMSGMPLFGGFDDETVRSVETDSDAPELVVSGVAVFGGVDVKHEPD